MMIIAIAYITMPHWLTACITMPCQLDSVWKHSAQFMIIHIPTVFIYFHNYILVLFVIRILKKSNKSI